MIFTVKRGEGLRGEISVPGDKSISHRSIILASLAEGESTISGLLEGEDCLATIEVFKKMGIDISSKKGVYSVIGNGLQGLKEPNEALDFGNSGTSIRLCAGLLSSQNFSSLLTGDKSLSTRPMRRVVDPLNAMGADLAATDEGTLPIKVSPVKSLHAIEYSLPVASAQVKSCLMLAGLFAEGKTKITEKTITRDHTERMFMEYGLPIEIKPSGQSRTICVNKVSRIYPQDIKVPGDFSSASFFILAALICPDSSIKIKNVGINETRIGFLHALRHMGANIELINVKNTSEATADILVKSSSLKGISLNTALVANMIDEMPAFFVAAALAEGITIVKDAKELRTKESDRLQAMADSLNAFGIKNELSKDGIVIHGIGSEGTLNSAEIDSYGDHRIAMASAIGSLRSDGVVKILDCVNVNTSFPNFIDVCREVGIDIST
jgi:3-phosphoshikimate 1-carboxyvinyltransferase